MNSKGILLKISRKNSYPDVNVELRFFNSLLNDPRSFSTKTIRSNEKVSEDLEYIATSSETSGSIYLDTSLKDIDDEVVCVMRNEHVKSSLQDMVKGSKYSEIHIYIPLCRTKIYKIMVSPYLRKQEHLSSKYEVENKYWLSLEESTRYHTLIVDKKVVVKEIRDTILNSDDSFHLQNWCEYQEKRSS